MRPMIHHETRSVAGTAPYTDNELETLAHYESAARAKANLLGLDPDEGIIAQHPTIKGARVEVPRWHGLVAELERFDMNMIALLCTAQDRKREDVNDAQGSLALS